MSSKKERLRELQKKCNSLQDNQDAQHQGPTKSNWSLHDLKTIRPQTDKQKDMVAAFKADKNIMSIGSPGTGKTYMALTLAFTDILTNESPQDHIVVVRSCVSTRDMGFLPGNKAEKMEPYEAPYIDITGDLFGPPSTYTHMKEAGLIEFMPTSFVRGLSWDDAVIVIDEAQNMTFHEIKSVITRAGRNSKVYICGDTGQNDLAGTKEVSGLSQLIEVVSLMESFQVIEFMAEDVLRSGLVKEFLTACEIDSEPEDDDGGYYDNWSTEGLEERMNITLDLTSTYGIILSPESFEEFVDIITEVNRRNELERDETSENAGNVLTFKAKANTDGENYEPH